MEDYHQPLLFDTKGYASSQIMLDDAFRKSHLLHLRSEEIDLNESVPSQSTMIQNTLAPRILLETLSSRTASCVLFTIYLTFFFAIAMPYLHSIGYLTKTTKMSGELCSSMIFQNSCTYIDFHGSNAWWAANVSNISWLAGSMRLDIEPENINASERSYVLEYDVYVYGGQFPLEQGHTKDDWLFARFNQSVWLHCPTSGCGRSNLFDISQDNEGLGGKGFGSYMIIILFHGYYPNLFAKTVNYYFSYTEPAIYISELIIRTVFFVITLFLLPWWTYRFYYRSTPMVPIQKYVLGLGIVLVFYQNPIFTIAQWYRVVNDSTRFASDVCQSIASALLRLAWLFLLEHRLTHAQVSYKVSFFLVDIAIHLTMCVLRFPKLFSIGKHESWYAILGFLSIFVTWFWLVWIYSICKRTLKMLKQLVYMVSRDEQLVYRFLMLELVLIFIYIFVASFIQVFHLLKVWFTSGGIAFIQACVTTFTIGAQPMEKVVFLTVFLYLTLYVNLPPAEEVRGSSSFYIEEKHQEDCTQHHRPESNVFCLETAEWLVQLAWQAYMDPLGNPSDSGNGVQTLEVFGFELVVHLRHELLDTQAIVCINRTNKRLVVAFRGSVSKAHWKTNMRFHQVPFWIHSMQGFKRKTTSSCRERAMRWGSRIPLMNLALPRVHSGFWKAYAAVRNDLKETLSLLLHDNPDFSLYVTGHSMGGALAILAAYDCAVHFNLDVSMYNFGGPRVGNPAFVRQYNRVVPNSHRIVLDGDLVAGIPRFWGLYQHVGTEIAIDEVGNLIVAPSFIERRLQQRSKTRVAVHGMLMYRSTLRKCFDNLQL